MSLILPESFAPQNLKLRPGVKARFVDGDLYNIAQRLQEVDPSIFVVELSEGDRATWAIMEMCQDGVERLIFKTDALDARVVDKAMRIKNVPLEKRLAEAEREEAEATTKREADELEKLYEDVGRPMWTQLEHDGFIQRGRSYSKAGMYGRLR